MLIVLFYEQNFPLSSILEHKLLQSNKKGKIMLLKVLREEKGVTQAEVALAIGVARYTYAKWEQGKAEPCILDIVKLLNYFDCKFEDLVGEENFNNNNSKVKTNDKQLKFISSFNLLSEDDKNKVLGYISALQK